MNNPFRPWSSREKIAFDDAITACKEQAGDSWRKLAEELSDLVEGQSISHVALQNWNRDMRVPIQWALVMDQYCDGCSIYDLCPYLKPLADKAA